MSCAIMFLISLFGEQQITESCYSAVYANQDDDVMKATLADLNRDSPKIRLVLSTSVSGMGFDPPSVTRVVHVCPPRSLSQYLEDVDKHPQLYYTTVNEILQVIYLECLMI
jgi:superfamily II DNA helicase RecQ